MMQQLTLWPEKEPFEWVKEEYSGAIRKYQGSATHVWESTDKSLSARIAPLISSSPMNEETFFIDGWKYVIMHVDQGVPVCLTAWNKGCQSDLMPKLKMAKTYCEQFIQLWKEGHPVTRMIAIPKPLPKKSTVYARYDITFADKTKVPIGTKGKIVSGGAGACNVEFEAHPHRVLCMWSMLVCKFDAKQEV